MTFWEKLRDYANRKVVDAYNRRYRSSHRCSVCHTWDSEVDGWLNWNNISRYIFETQCKKCKQWTRWDNSSGIIVVWTDDQPLLSRTLCETEVK